MACGRGFAWRAAILVAAIVCKAESNLDDMIASHAAMASLAALEETAYLEGLMLASEQVAAASGGGRTPIEMGHAHASDMGRLLEAALSSVRHALVSGALESHADLAEASRLDMQLSALLVAYFKEPVFFWHGPRRLALPRLRRLLGGVHDELVRLSAKRPELLPQQWAEHLAAAEEPEPVVDTMGDVALALGEACCGRDGSDLDDALRELTSGGRTAQVLILPSPEDALLRIGSALQFAGEQGVSFKVSLAVTPEVGDEGIKAAEQAVMAAMEALNLKAIDVLYLPPALLYKRNWGETKKRIDRFIRQGVISGYGAQTERTSKEYILNVLNRKPAPVAWLTPHDPLRPMKPDVAQAARQGGVIPFALPGHRPERNIIGQYLEIAAAGDAAAEHRWALESGLSVFLEVGRFKAGLLSSLQESQPLPAHTGAVLRSLAPFSQPNLRASDISGKLGTRLSAVHLKAAEAATQEAQKVDSAGTTLPADTPEMPAVSPGVLKDEYFEREKVQFDENFYLIYAEELFDAATYAAIRAETRRLWVSEDMEANCNLDGKDRLGGYVYDHRDREDSDNSLYNLIYGNEKFRRWVSTINQNGEMWPSDFPIELREYGPESNGMMCHSDLQMYADAGKNLEFVLTVDNDSKCNTSFWDKKGDFHEVNSAGNSVFMLRPNAARHCASSTGGVGSRTILKFIYVGDYQKSPQFAMYSGNVCRPGNPNVKAMERRRNGDDHMWHQRIQSRSFEL